MSLEAVRSLRDKWRGLPEIKSGIEAAFKRIGFTEEYVEDRILAADQPHKPKKYIKDNVWGMIEVDDAVVRLLDSPILQRLRSIRQTGLSYLTYPSAEHSRFIHSLGMSSVVSKFLEAIDKRADGDPSNYAGQRYIKSTDLGFEAQELVHAAVLHDCGHLPFSHATERALDSNLASFKCGGDRPLGEFKLDVALALQTSKDVSLSEALSLVIVLSERFDRFYQRYVRRGNADESSVLRIACLIAGLPPAPNLTGVSEIISSASVDADKIDYISRDAAACGIPVGVDVSRIFLRSGFLEINQETSRKYDLRDPPIDDEVLFVVNASGVDTLDEISQSRASLYQRVYLHPVTRTAEAVLTQALGANAVSVTPIDHLIDAFDLWSRSDDAVLRDLAESKDQHVAMLGSALLSRSLPKKACVFSAQIAETHFPLREIFRTVRLQELKDLEKKIVNDRLEALSLHQINHETTKLVESEIADEIVVVAETLKAAGKASLVKGEKPKSVVLVPRAYMDKIRRDAIVLQNGDLLRTPDYTNVQGQQDALDIFKSVGFIMSDREWRSIAMLASRVVLARHSQELVRTNIFDDPAPEPAKVAQPTQMQPRYIKRLILDHAAVARRAGIARNDVDEVVAALVSAGYFDDKPLLAPHQDSASEKVGTVHERLKKFDGERSWQVTRRTVAAFVSQFPPKHRPTMLEALSKITYFGTDELASSLSTRLAALPPGDVAPASFNSGARAFSNIKDRPALNAFGFFNTLEQALEESDAARPIYLVDDNISSATQARAQVLAWLGVSEDEWPEECKGEQGIRRERLSDERRERLAAREVSFVVAAGQEAGRRALKKLFKDRSLRFGDLHYATDLKGHDWHPELRAFLEQVGRSVLSWMKYDKDYEALSSSQKKFCRENALGYAGVGALVCTPDSVPTSTVTALWCPGMFMGSPWMPLILRRGRLKNLIVG